MKFVRMMAILTVAMPGGLGGAFCGVFIGMVFNRFDDIVSTACIALTMCFGALVSALVADKSLPR